MSTVQKRKYSLGAITLKEWKRIVNWKTLIVIISLCIGNIILFTYAQLDGRSLRDTLTAADEYQFLINRYAGMSIEDAIERIDIESSAVHSERKNESWEEQYHEDTGCREIIVYYKNLNEAGKIQLELQIKELKEKLDYLNSYPSDVAQTIQNAEKLKKFSVFSKPNSFAYHNILKTASDYERVNGLIPSLENDKAVDCTIHYYYVYYFAFGFMVMIIYGMFSERENGMWYMVHSAANGRFRLSLKRLTIILGTSFLITAVLYTTTFFVALFLYGGWKNLNTPIQSITACAQFTYPISKLQYMGFNFILAWFALFTVSTILWMFFVLFRNRNHTLVFVAAFVGVESMLYYKISVQNVYNFFHYINIMNIFRINEILKTYTNWGFHTYVFSVLSITLVILLLLLFVATVIAVIKSAKMKPLAKKTIVAKFFLWLNQQYQKMFTSFPLTVKELHKLVVTGKGIWVIVAIIVIAAYFSANGRMNFTDSQAERDEMYLINGGSEYTYIEDYVKEIECNYEKEQQKLEEAASAYDREEIDLKTYTKEVASTQYAGNKVKSVEEFTNKIKYLEKIQQVYNIDGYMMSDRGYEEIFGQYSRQRELILILLLVTGIMLIISECMTMEYRTGMHMIVRSCSNGRNWLFIRKIVACLLFTTLFFLIIYGMDFLMLRQYYGMPYLQAPVMSLTFMEGTGFRVSVMNYLCIILGVRYIICIIAMVVAILISGMIGKKRSRALMPLTLVGMLTALIVLHGFGGLI